MCEGRVCIVTGAGRGLGREYALSLARHGAKVVVNDLGGGRDGSGADAGPAQEVVDEIIAAGGEAVANTDDISSWDGAARLVQQAIDTFGGLDVLVNNAGILRDRMIFSMTEEEWDSVIRVHLKGTFAPSHHATAYWRERSKAGEPVDARLVNTTSVSGLYANVSQTNYGAAKAGIAAFTQIAAQEVARYGVTVNAIAPGALTRMTSDVPMSDEIRQNFEPTSVAPVITWLASPDSADVTGQVIEASGLVLAVAEGWHRGPSTEAGRVARGGRAARARAVGRGPSAHVVPRSELTVADAWIVDVVRTPRGKGRADGALHAVHPQELLAQCLRALATRGRASIRSTSTTSWSATASSPATTTRSAAWRPSSPGGRRRSRA